ACLTSPLVNRQSFSSENVSRNSCAASTKGQKSKQYKKTRIIIKLSKKKESYFLLKGLPCFRWPTTIIHRAQRIAVPTTVRQGLPIENTQHLAIWKLPAPIDQLRQKCRSCILFIPAHPHFTDHHLRFIARNHILHILHTLLCTLLPVILIRVERHADHIPF